jgi:hypothetical protein
MELSQWSNNAVFISADCSLEMLIQELIRYGMQEDEATVTATIIKGLFRKQEKAYICSPLMASSMEMVRRNVYASQIYLQEAERECDVMGVAPHAALYAMLVSDDPNEKKVGLDLRRQLMGKCERIFVCGNQLTGWMVDEIKMAAKYGKAISVFHLSLLPDVQKIAVSVDPKADVKKGNSGILALAVDFLVRDKA